MPCLDSSARYVVRAGTVLGGGAAAVLALTLMVATEPLLPIVWDEGFTLIRLARVRAWIDAVRDPDLFAARWNRRGFGVAMDDRVLPPRASEINTRSKLLSRPAIAWFWPFARDEPHGHPPFYALLALIGDGLTPWRNELSRARLGAMLLVAATTGGVFAALATRRGFLVGPFGRGALALSPQLFAMGHYAHYDAPLTCLWLASILTFAEAAIPAAPSTARRSPRVGLGRLLRDSGGCGGRNQADRVAAAVTVPLLDRLLPRPQGCPDSRPRGGRGGGDCLRAHAALVVFAVAGAYRVLSLEPHAGRDHADPGPVSGDRLPVARPVAPLVQHAGLDGRREPGRFPGVGSGGFGSNGAERGDRFASLAMICWVFPLVWAFKRDETEAIAAEKGSDSRVRPLADHP